MAHPRDVVQGIETRPKLPEGTEERFAGYGVMGLPFRSGHVLALRRFVVTSIGPGYTSVWHRAPSGEWTFYQDAPAEQACPRYFGPGLTRAVQTPVELRWTGPDSFSVEIDGGKTLSWEVSLDTPPAMRAMNAMASAMPRPMWRNEAVLRFMGVVARGLLGAGRLGLTGKVPSGQWFIANPLTAWAIASSRARVRGEDLGDPGPLPDQERLGDFWIPQRGIFAVGHSIFEPFDPARHSSEIPGTRGRSSA